jgi:hypothetical protein
MPFNAKFCNPWLFLLICVLHSFCLVYTQSSFHVNKRGMKKKSDELVSASLLKSINCIDDIPRVRCVTSCPPNTLLLSAYNRHNNVEFEPTDTDLFITFPVPIPFSLSASPRRAARKLSGVTSYNKLSSTYTHAAQHRVLKTKS